MYQLAEERINKFEERSVEVMQSEEWRWKNEEK
jgi:hypothetical protein